MHEIALTLTIRALTGDDVSGFYWAGGETHLKSVRKQLELAASGGADYLGVFLSSGQSAGKAAITYRDVPDAGVIFQVAVHPALQSCGIGTRLMLAAEQQIARRGLIWAEVGVELDNPRARKLYERLGYEPIGNAQSSWDQERPDGTIYRHETTLTRMRKPLRPMREKSS